METFAEGDDVAVRCDPGDDLLGSIEHAIGRHDLQDATVVGGVGTLSRLRVYYLDASKLSRPREERDVVRAEPGNWEITSLSGVVADSEPHVHVGVHEGDRTLGGHLLSGSPVSALAEVALRRTGLSLRREADDDDVRRLTHR
jgi:predicted DNA-binding protein with PD1-like motif